MMFPFEVETTTLLTPSFISLEIAESTFVSIGDRDTFTFFDAICFSFFGFIPFCHSLGHCMAYVIVVVMLLDLILGPVS
jgi:hypothetical protein